MLECLKALEIIWKLNFNIYMVPQKINLVIIGTQKLSYYI